MNNPELVTEDERIAENPLNEAAHWSANCSINQNDMLLACVWRGAIMHVFPNPGAAYDFAHTRPESSFSIFMQSAVEISKLTWSRYQQRYVLAVEWSAIVDHAI